MKKILNILLAVLMAVTVALLVYALAAPHSDDVTAYDASISLNIIWGYSLFLAAVASAIFCAVWGMIKNPKGVKGSLLSLLLIVVVTHGEHHRPADRRILRSRSHGAHRNQCDRNLCRIRRSVPDGDRHGDLQSFQIIGDNGSR